jgi:hypothetical protein
MLGNAAGSATQPAGLRFGVSAIAATSGADDNAMAKDLGNLAAAVAPVGGSQIAFVASPGEATKILLRSGGSFPYPVIPSSALAAGVVMAVATNALVTVVDPQPDIEASQDATLHLSDTPVAIGTAGAPPTIAATTHGLFQSGEVAIRLILGVSFGLRSAGAVAWVGSVTW